MQALEQARIVLHQIHNQAQRQTEQAAGLTGNRRFAGGLTQQVDHPNEFTGLDSPDREQIIENRILPQQPKGPLQQ